MDTHIRDGELLMDLDGELTPERSAEVRRHLEGCARCRARRSAIESTLSGIAPAEALPPMAKSRSELRSRMHRTWRPYAYTAVAALALVGFVYQARWWKTFGSVTPNAELTPGATIAVTREAVCVLDDEPRPVDTSLAMKVFAHYGIRNPRPRAFEVDYLITPALGGSDDIRNLWPQPYSAGVWNARVKDALEDHLRRLVCEGKLDLESAQREIAQDWIGAYKKYFHTESPLVDHLSFVKDPPWGD